LFFSVTTEEAPMTTMTERPVHTVVKGEHFHWVGDGFRVTNLFPSGADLGRMISPFLLMDYHPPYEYEPTDRPRGVGVHPHRGFETVTLAFEGSVAHHDSTGAGGVIHPGDVQWMTAASGILHKEYHEAEWAKTGGTFHMVQLWVNLPAENKMDPPGYQGLTAEMIGSVDLPDGAGIVRVVAGDYLGHHGPARTVTPMDLWDLQLTGEAPVELAFPPDRNVSLLVVEGAATVNGARAEHRDLVVLDNVGEAVRIQSEGAARLLLLGGEPIDDPLVFYGPFVMNTREQIIQAIEDFDSGKFGYLED
jgi:redox-sensitive bicupin YhaK (pirin superfamily)